MNCSPSLDREQRPRNGFPGYGFSNKTSTLCSTLHCLSLSLVLHAIIRPHVLSQLEELLAKSRQETETVKGELSLVGSTCQSLQKEVSTLKAELARKVAGCVLVFVE